MITPEYLNEIMYAVEDKLVDLDEYLIKRIVKRIEKTFELDENNLFIPSTKHDIKKLLNAGVLYEDIQSEVEKALPDIQGIVRETFLKSANEINKQNLDIAQAIVDYEGLNIIIPHAFNGIPKTTSDLHMTDAEIRQLETAYRRTNGDVRNLTRSTARKAQESYINACDSAYMKVKNGVSVQTAVIEAIKEVSDKGIECVSYGGKSEKIEVAISRAVRTGVNQANGNIALVRCAEMGVGYVKTSSHLGARVTANDDYTNHAWWQGKVYSVSWDSPQMLKVLDNENIDYSSSDWLKELKTHLDGQPKHDYPDFIESCGYGNILGIVGINCRHSFYPFYPGIQLNDDDRPNLEENEKRYKLEQRQRAMERAIRKTKRELAGVKAIESDNDEIRVTKKQIKDKLHKQSDVYMEFCKSNNLKPRNMALKI